jgi:ankyrin repeat protein
MRTTERTLNPLTTYLGQGWFVSKMKAMGYKITDGQCAGIAHLGMQAFLANDVDTFINRLAFIHDKKINYFNAIKNNSKNGDYRKLNKNDTFSPFELYAFFDGIRLIQSPQFYQYLKPCNEKHLLQIKKPFADLLAPIGSDDKKSPILIDSFSGSYTKDDLTVYLHLLSTTLTVKTALILRSSNHEINLNYDPTTKTWALIDANHLPCIYFDDINQLANQVVKSFKVGLKAVDNAVFNTEIYTANNDGHTLSNTIKALKQKPSWIKVHTVTNNRILLKDAFDTSWLYIATIGGKKNTVKALLNHKSIDVNATKKNSVTPLYIATQNGYKDIVEMLLKQRANVNCAKNNGLTPLFIAAEYGWIPIVKALLLHKAIRVNLASHNGVTALYMAAQNGHTEIVELLLKSSANVNSIGIKGFTPLQVACLSPHTKGSKKLFSLLLEYGANTTHKNHHGQTAMMIAKKNNNLVAQYVLSHHKSLKNNHLNTRFFNSKLNQEKHEKINMSMLNSMFS